MAYIYKITNNINGKCYIGKTTYPDPDTRWHQHIRAAKRGVVKNRPLYKAINLYGADYFTFSVLEKTDHPAEREIFYIDYYDTYKNGYNATRGGDGRAYINNRKEILDYYIANKSTVKELASKFSVCRDTVVNILRENNVDYDRYPKSTAMSKLVYQYDMNGVLINTFPSSREAARYLGNINLNSPISECCRGIRKSLLGYKWSYTIIT